MKLDHYTKKLTTDVFLKLLLFAQLQEIESLHALSDFLFDDQLQKGIDLDSISISQFSRRLNNMNQNIFQRLYLDLVSQNNWTNQRWAKFRKTKEGVKLSASCIYGKGNNLSRESRADNP